MNVLLLLVGTALLATGGEVLVRGALAGARRLGVSPLLIGLVVVGFGTSTPELVVSVDAALRASPDIAVGNVVGSNVANVLLILGVCAVIAPLTARALAVRRDALAVVAASVLLIGLAHGRVLGRLDAVILLAALVAYVVWAYVSERHVVQRDGAATIPRPTDGVTGVSSPLWISLQLGLGLAALIGGARMLVAGAVGVAAAIGVPEAVVGLSVVAVGTSLPELAVSIVATMRRHTDIAVGNVLGSNVFNVLGILGVSALSQPLAIAARIVQFDLWVMLAAAMLTTVLLLTGRRLSRREGGVLLLAYVAYVWLGFTVFAS